MENAGDTQAHRLLCDENIVDASSIDVVPVIDAAERLLNKVEIANRWLSASPAAPGTGDAALGPVMIDLIRLERTLDAIGHGPKNARAFRVNDDLSGGVLFAVGLLAAACRQFRMEVDAAMGPAKPLPPFASLAPISVAVDAMNTAKQRCNANPVGVTAISSPEPTMAAVAMNDSSDEVFAADGPDQLVPFTGGEMRFFAERIELCGACICSGQRRTSLRKLLTLLAKRDNPGFSGEELAAALGSPGPDAASSLVTRSRKQIWQALHNARIESNLDDVILGGGPGYRLSDSICVSVQSAFDEKLRDEVADTSALNVHDEADISTRNVPNVHDARRVAGTNVHDNACEDVHDVHDCEALRFEEKTGVVQDAGASAERRAWILSHLASGEQLRAPDIANRLNCTPKTIHRALASLKKEGRITFEGPPRTGFYRLVESGESQTDIKQESSQVS
jgi:biotin operon repressor